MWVLKNGVNVKNRWIFLRCFDQWECQRASHRPPYRLKYVKEAAVYAKRDLLEMAKIASYPKNVQMQKNRQKNVKKKTNSGTISESPVSPNAPGQCRNAPTPPRHQDVTVKLDSTGIRMEIVNQNRNVALGQTRNGVNAPQHAIRHDAVFLEGGKFLSEIVTMSHFLKSKSFFNCEKCPLKDFAVPVCIIWMLKQAKNRCKF